MFYDYNRSFEGDHNADAARDETDFAAPAPDQKRLYLDQHIKPAEPTYWIFSGYREQMRTIHHTKHFILHMKRAQVIRSFKGFIYFFKDKTKKLIICRYKLFELKSEFSHSRRSYSFWHSGFNCCQKVYEPVHLPWVGLVG